MFTGTNHFRTINDALAYYADLGFTAADVKRKIRDGEIAIGKPDVPEGADLLINAEGRYVICERD